MDKRAENLRNQKINYFVKSKFGNEISFKKPQLKIQSIDVKNKKTSISNIEEYLNYNLNKKATVFTPVYTDVNELVDKKFIKPKEYVNEDIGVTEAKLFIDFSMIAIDGQLFETFDGQQINTISG